METIGSRVLRYLEKFPKDWLSPTEIGVGIGFHQDTASSKVCPSLKTLVKHGLVEKNKLSRTCAYYKVLEREKDE